MLRKRPFARGCSDATEFALTKVKRAHRLIGISCDEDFVAGGEERVEASPRVRKHGRAASRCFKQPARRTPAHFRHVPPGHIEGQTRRGEKRRMLAWRQVAHEKQ